VGSFWPGQPRLPCQLDTSAARPWLAGIGPTGEAMASPLHALLALLVQLGVGIVLPAWIVRRDERRLGEELLRRAWPPASFWCAVVAFGLLCLPVHFTRTRRSAKGLLLGIAWSLGVALVQVGLGSIAGAYDSP
jgi:hypothetical protein